MSQSSKKPKAVRELSQVGRFGAVGVLNTGVDVVILNVLVMVFGVGVVVAGVISGTIAMINSYIFNQRFTFKTRNVSHVQTVYFFGITIFGIYVIRPLILQFFTKQWLWPANLTYHVTQALRLPLSQAFDTRNFAFGVAIVVVLGYNYLLYKKFVFVEKKR